MPRTVPSIPLTDTKSPTAMGLSKRSVTPPTRLLNAPCMARLTATPAEATRVITLVRGMPITLTAVRITITYRMILMMLLRKLLRVGSIFTLEDDRAASFRIPLTMMKPMMRVIAPQSSLTPWVLIRVEMSSKFMPFPPFFRSLRKPSGRS